LAFGRTVEYERTDSEVDLDAGLYFDAGIKF